MKKQTSMLAVMLCIVSLSLIFTGCSKSLESQLVGSWYREGNVTTNRDGGKGPAFTLYSDGTCEIASEYGTGTWAVVNENQLKLTNFYGESETITIVSIEDGCLTLDGDMTYWDSIQEN